MASLLAPLVSGSVLVAALTASLAATTPATATTAPTVRAAHSAGYGDSRAGADVVRAWNATAMTTLVTAATPVAEQPLHLAYVHRAVYDGVRRAARSERAVSVRAVVAEAAYTVLSTNFPAQRPALDAALATTLAAVPADRARSRGLALGQRAAERELRERADDGRNGQVLPVPAPGVGVWAPLPPNVVGASSWLGSVRPFALRSGAQLRLAPPPSLHSALWTRDYREVRVLGSATSTVRTPQQTETARFWSDPPLVQNQRGLRDHTLRHGLGVRSTARLFALADMASADSLIACYDSKYHYSFWRPATAIPAGDSDGNPRTAGEPGWTSLVGTPNFPEYPSAHGCSTTAVADVVAALDHGRLDLDLTSVVTGTARHYSSVDQLISEVGNARVWGGLHWRFSTTLGEGIGHAAARAVLRQQRW